MKRISINTLIIFATLFGAMFAFSNAFIDSKNTPKHICAISGILFFLLYNIIYRHFKKNYIYNINNIAYVIAFTATCQAIYGIMQYYEICESHGIFNITGSFENPAGFASCIAVSFPFSLYILDIHKNKYYLWSSPLVIITATILSQSRSGILCISMISVIWILQKTELKFKWKLSITLLVTAIIIGCLYYAGRNSADGRIFIWRRTIEMIKEKPLFGYGLCGFKGNYMNFQANYFKSVPQSKHCMIADNVHHPFNEYLNLVSSFGLFGLTLLITFVVFVLICYIKKHSLIGKYALLSCISTAIFAFFSYPFMYAYVWLTLFLSIYIIIELHICKEKMHIPFIHKRYITVLSIACIIPFIKMHWENIQNELKWKCAYTTYCKGNRDEAINAYKYLLKRTKNRYIIYNYAAILYKEHQYDESLIIARSCKKQWADYDIEILIGEILNKQDKHEAALQHFNNAANMCPAKFIPLLRMQRMYKKNGDTIMARSIAKKIIEKPVKINSDKIDKIKELMANELK